MLFVRGLFACLMFLLLLGGSWVAGSLGFMPDLRSTMGIGSARPVEAYRTGWIIYEQPDGLLCSYAAFDTKTERVSEPDTALCRSAASKLKASGQKGLSGWGRD